MSAPRAQFQLSHPAASPEEAAAIVAALERFMRATAPSPAPAAERRDPWLASAIAEGVARDPWADPADPWINT
jgi:hypothetical protein